MNLKWLSDHNSKLKDSSVRIFAWSLPAGKTCPQAKGCRNICYAQRRRFLWEPAVERRERNLKLALDGRRFLKELTDDLIRISRIKDCFVRLHDSGDFFNELYARNWRILINQFPEIQFYAYTKSVEMVKGNICSLNFRPIFSLGGRQDRLISVQNDRHARIFRTRRQLLAAKYVDGSKDDAVAATSPSLCIGLVLKK